MKYLIIFILFQLIELSTFGQCDNSLIGDWKVVSCYNGEVYFNLKNDSSYLTAEIKVLYPDSISQKALVQAAKDIYGSFIYHYDRNGTFDITADSHFFASGKYCFIPTNRILRETTINSLGKEVIENVDAKLQNGFLFLSKKWDEAKMYDLVLEKINK